MLIDYPAHDASAENCQRRRDGKYAPTAKDSERTPSSSTAITRETPSSTSPHGSLRRQDAVDDGGHEPALRRGGLFAADALDPLTSIFPVAGL